MQRFSLYRVHKVYPRTDGTTHARTHGTTAALLYPHRNALRGDNNNFHLLLSGNCWILQYSHSHIYFCHHLGWNHVTLITKELFLKHCYPPIYRFSSPLQLHIIKCNLRCYWDPVSKGGGVGAMLFVTLLCTFSMPWDWRSHLIVRFDL